MNHLLALLAHHGYVLVFAVVLAEALGLPAPAALALMAAGAAAAAGTLSPTIVFTVALVAMLLGDSIAFRARRLHGLGIAWDSLPSLSESR